MSRVKLVKKEDDASKKENYYDNKLSIKNIIKTREFIVGIITLIQLIGLLLYNTKIGENWEWLGYSNVNIVGIISLAIICYGYSYYSSKQWLGLFILTLNLCIVTLYQIIYGATLTEAISSNNMELIICILGIIIMVSNVAIIKNKLKKNIKNNTDKKSKNTIKIEDINIKNLYNNPISVKWYYKLMIYCFMFTTFMFTYANSNLPAVDSPFLKTILLLQTMLPTYIIIAYITFTDLTVHVLIIYNIIYVVAGAVIIKYTGFSLYVLLNLIMMTLMIRFNIKEYKIKSSRI